MSICTKRAKIDLFKYLPPELHGEHKFQKSTQHALRKPMRFLADHHGHSSQFLIRLGMNQRQRYELEVMA